MVVKGFPQVYGDERDCVGGWGAIRQTPKMKGGGGGKKKKGFSRSQ